LNSPWREQSPITDPGESNADFAALPRDVAGVCAVVANLLVHCDWFHSYGLDEARFSGISRDTLPVSQRLKKLAEGGGSLLTPRQPKDRSLSTCRDYAVLLCSILRSQGHQARVRCGFAAYFEPGKWEDHWVCEHRLSADARWSMVDAQIDDTLREQLHLSGAFRHTDLSASDFMTAGDAWLKCRAGLADPAHFGHGETGGLWFMHVNVVRDHLSLHHRETSGWDSWRRADKAQRRLSDASLAWLDHLAGNPEAGSVHLPEPAWGAFKSEQAGT
jgi:hypothetical protein